MNKKQIGIFLVIIGILLASFLFFAKQREDAYIDQIIQQQGGICYLDGVCLHDQEFTSYFFGAIPIIAIIILGVYLFFFDTTEKQILKQHKEVTSALNEAKSRDEFQAYLAGFVPEEQKVLKAIQEQEGIQQSTLRYRINMSKTSLSLVLKSLEERGIITKKEHGKTNILFLVKKF